MVIPHTYTIINFQGYINSGPLDELYPYIDAANVDLKGLHFVALCFSCIAFTEDFYKKVCGAKLSSVLETLERLHTKHPHVWIEIAYLVIPGHNDSVAEISQAAQWIKEHIGPHVPLHLSRFFPKYKLNTVPPTPERTLIEAAKAAKEHLQVRIFSFVSLTQFSMCMLAIFLLRTENSLVAMYALLLSLIEKAMMCLCVNLGIQTGNADAVVPRFQGCGHDCKPVVSTLISRLIDNSTVWFSPARKLPSQNDSYKVL